MRRLCSFMAALNLALLASSTPMADEPRDNQTAETFSVQITRTLKLDYLLHLPPGYASDSTQRWPLMLFLHGAGERGTNLWAVAVHGPPKIVKTQPDFPFILVAPQCPSGRVWEGNELIALLDDIQKKYRVDERRVYLTGLSMGGYGSWSLAVSHPERFAAVAPICGGGEPIGIYLAAPEKVAALKALPVWAFHGGKDPVVRLEESQRMVAALKQIGCQEVELTVYPEADHDSWTQTYSNPKLFEWFLKHERK